MVAIYKVSPGDEIIDDDVNQFASWIAGEAGIEQAANLVRWESATVPTLTLQNLDETNGAPSFLIKNSDDTADVLKVYHATTNNTTPVIEMDESTRVSIGQDFSSGSWPHTLSIIKVAPTSGWITVNVVHDITGEDTDEAAGRFIMRQLEVDANSSVRALETQTIKAYGDVNHACWAQEVGVHQQIAHGHGVNLYLTGDPQQWINPGATRYRMESAVYMASPAGWESPIKYYHTDGTTVGFRVAGGGASGDLLGDVYSANYIYSGGFTGSDRIGIIDHTGAPSGKTWGGMSYDNGTSMLWIGAFKNGTAYRDVHISPAGGNVRLGSVNYSTIVGSSALNPGATDGFLYIPGGAGIPTGTPTTYTGRNALYVDTTNHKMYFYDSAWRILN